MKFSQPNAKHRFAFLRLKFTVSFFSLPCKRLENTRKALKIKPLVLFRAKSWFRINGREKISGLTLPTFCRLDHNIPLLPLFNASLWGVETKARPHFEVLRAKLKHWAPVVKENGSRGILPFPLCPKSAKAAFNGPNWTIDFSARNSQRVPWKKSQNMVK